MTNSLRLRVFVVKAGPNPPRRHEESRSVFPALSTNLILRLKSPSVNHEVVQHQAVGNTEKRNGPEESFAERSSLVKPPRLVKNPPAVQHGPTCNHRQHSQRDPRRGSKLGDARQTQVHTSDREQVQGNQQNGGQSKPETEMEGRVMVDAPQRVFSWGSAESSSRSVPWLCPLFPGLRLESPQWRKPASRNLY